MQFRTTTNAIAAALLAVTLFPAAPARAAQVDIKMLTDGPDHPMQFVPELVRIAPGDTVRFVATDPGHAVKTIPGMIPAGAQPFSGDFGQTLSVTLTQQGVYGFQCQPHGAMGMVGLIVVGQPVNAAEAAAAPVPGMARRTFAKLFEILQSR